MTSCRVVLWPSPSWTLLWPGSSGNPWQSRSSCLLCGTRPSAGGPAGTGCAAVVPPRRSWTCSYHGNILLIIIIVTERSRQTDACFMRGTCVCVCVLTIYVSVGAKNKRQSEPIWVHEWRTKRKLEGVKHRTESLIKKQPIRKEQPQLRLLVGSFKKKKLEQNQNRSEQLPYYYFEIYRKCDKASWCFLFLNDPKLLWLADRLGDDCDWLIEFLTNQWAAVDQ